MYKKTKKYIVLISIAIIAYLFLVYFGKVNVSIRFWIEEFIFILLLMNAFELAELDFRKKIKLKSIFNKENFYKRAEIFEKNSIMCQAFRADSKKVFLYFCLFFVGYTTIFYSDFLLGAKDYIFEGGAIDSLTQTFPWYLYQAREWTMGHIWGRWNFVNSLGKYEKAIFPSITNVLVIFGEKNIAFLMGFFQYIKVLLSGFFFYGYLRMMGRSRRSSALFSFLYAYNPWLTTLGYWRGYPGESVMLAVWLYCFERYKRKGDARWLPLATALFFLDMEAYLIILYSAIFFAYCIFSFFSEKKDEDSIFVFLKNILFTIICIVWGWVISCYTCIPDLINNLNSNRLDNDINNHALSGVISSMSVITTTIARAIGTRILGLYAGNHGMVLGEPIFYCGLLTLCIIPLAIYGMKKNKRNWYMFSFLVIIVYIVFVPLRAASNAFSSEQFNNSSFWIIVVMLITAAYGMDVVENLDYNKRKKINRVTGAFIIAAIIILISFQWLFYNELHFSILLLLLYLISLSMDIKRINIHYIAFILTFVEICYMFISPNIFTVINGNWKQRRMYYNDHSVEAIDAIKKSDDDFYRISKEYIYQRLYLCDSLAQNYMGTVGYNGGVGDQHYTSEFFRELSFPIYRNDHFTYGFNESTAVNTLVNVRYVLSKYDMPLNYGYSLVDKNKDVYSYKNDNYLPLGVTYNKYILREDFDKLTIAEKRNIIMHAIVLENKPDAQDLSQINPESPEAGNSLSYIKNIDNYITDNKSNEKGVIEIDPLEEDEVLVVELKVNNQDDELYVANPELIVSDLDNIISFKVLNDEEGEEKDDFKEYSYHQGFLKGEDTYIYEFNNPGTYFVKINITDQMELEDYHIYVMPKDIYYKDYIESVNALKKDSMDSVKYDNNIVTGKINNSVDQMIFFAIPYDKDWHLYIDGKERELLLSNVGFMGATIEKGIHNVELHYEPDGRYVRYSAIGMTFYIIFFTIYEIVLLMKKREKKYD